MQNDFKRILVTGASRGIGLELVRQILEGGKGVEKVFGTVRNDSKELNALKEKFPNQLVNNQCKLLS